MRGRSHRRREAERLGTGTAGGGDGEAPLSPTAIRCLDRQLADALDLAVTCRVLSDWSRAGGDPLTAVALQRLSAELIDQAAVLAPLVRPDPDRAVPPSPESSPSGLGTCVAHLDERLSRAELVAQSDALSPGLETSVASLLWTLAALYRTRRELLLVCTLLDSA